MKIALYGLPCAGKTTLLEKLKKIIPVINGGEELKKLEGTITEKRQKLLELLKKKEDFIIDGHYQFIQNGKIEIAYTTEHDVFDCFMYLYQNPKVILERLKTSDKNQKFLPITEKPVEDWQCSEITSLRKICHTHEKDFYIIDDCATNYEYFNGFVMEVIDGYSNVNYAKQIVSEINFDDKEITLLDGDKTITKVDTSKHLLNFKTNIFDNNFYTGYQFWIQDKLIDKTFNRTELKQKIKKLEYNQSIIDMAKNPIIISSGIKEIWVDIIGKMLNIKTYAGKNVSAETKYFVTKFLKDRYKVTAFGDSKNDLYMLQEADKGYLVINNHLSRSLKKDEVQELNIINFSRRQVILNEDKSIDSKTMHQINELIKMTKSDSGVSGSRLANAHLELGKHLSNYLNHLDPKDTTIISLERSGHFLADGMYLRFDCKFETFNSKYQNFPKINTKNIVLVDGVINNGTSMIETINAIESIYSSVKIVVVTGVINEKAMPLFDMYDFIAARVSKNKFTGSNVKQQKENIGPDTADRLFNQLC